MIRIFSTQNKEDGSKIEVSGSDQVNIWVASYGSTAQVDLDFNQVKGLQVLLAQWLAENQEAENARRFNREWRLPR